MAVVIASALDKDVAGAPLFRGVSFKLERGDRMTLAGRNGAGKTTLLRMLAGQSGVDGGELVFEKGSRVALHDQRPPRETGLSLRDYVLAGCSDLIALEERLRLELACEGDRAPPRPRLQGRPARPAARQLLRWRAHPRLPGPGARRRSRPPPARRAHQPPRHRIARVARGGPDK